MKLAIFKENNMSGLVENMSAWERTPCSSYYFVSFFISWRQVLAVSSI